MKRGRNVKSKESNRICIEIWNDYEPKLRKICNVKMSNHPDYIDDVMQIDLPYENDFSDLYVERAFLDEFKKTLENELSKDDKEFIYYIYEKRLKMKEIAYILDSTESAVKQRHYRLINKIRKMVNKIL